VFDNSKAFTKAPNLITEELNVAFTIYINWLNHARVVNFMHVFWYIEFKTNDVVISSLTTFLGTQALLCGQLPFQESGLVFSFVTAF
jgi:hypothetical protein